MNPQIEYDDSFYVISCKDCNKKNTSACNNCKRKKTEPKPKSDCHQCSEKPAKNHNCTCETTRKVCNDNNHFVVLNYFGELVHSWERELAKYNLGIQELDSINYFTEESPNGEVLTKVLFVFRRGHELITKEFVVAPKGEKGDKGDSLTWDKLTPLLKEALRGDKGADGAPGETPDLGHVYVNYTDVLCEISGMFERRQGTNIYDLYLTLPKQKSYEDYLNQLTLALNEIKEFVNDKICNLDPFDFSKLGLSFNGSELALTYNGYRHENSTVTLNIPQLHEYALKYHKDVNDKWEDYITLLKDGQEDPNSGIFRTSRFRPIDWWILPYPGVILVNNGQLVTKRIRVSAWKGAEDMTNVYRDTNEKHYDLYIQTTGSYYYNDEGQYRNSWSSLNSNEYYNEKTGILTLPENYTIKDISETVDGVQYSHCQYVYNTGDFLTVSLWATDSRPRRTRIPIIDITNSGESYDYFSNFVNIDPRNISDDIQYAIITYTNTYQFDLTGLNFYDNNGNIINNVIKVSPSTVIYKHINGKKYFCGNFEIVTGEDIPTYTTQLKINSFVLTEIFHEGIQSKKFGLKFKYNDNGTLKDLTSDLTAAFYNYWSNHIDSSFYKVIRLKNNNTNQFVDIDLTPYSTTNTPGIIYYDYVDTDIENPLGNGTTSVGGRRPGVSNTGSTLLDDIITNYKLYIKNGTEYNVYLNIYKIGSDIVLSLPSGNIYDYDTYLNIFNLKIMLIISNSEVIDVNSEVPQTVYAPSGTVIANGMFFYDGLFIGKSQLGESNDEDVLISDAGDYAYITDVDSVKVLNLTNKPIEVTFGDRTFTVAAGVSVEEELTPTEPRV